MKKYLVLLSLFLFVNFSYANWDLEEQVNEQINTYYQELVQDYEDWIIKKEKIFENLRNRIYVLREIYWDKLNDSFYEEKLELAENIDKIWDWVTTDEEVNNDEEVSNNDQYEIPESYKKIIEKTIFQLNSKLSEDSLQARNKKFEQILSKIAEKKDQLDQMNKTKQNKLLLWIIECLENEIKKYYN